MVEMSQGETIISFCILSMSFRFFCLGNCALKGAVRFSAKFQIQWNDEKKHTFKVEKE
jgi:hypothetical protein